MQVVALNYHRLRFGLLSIVQKYILVSNAFVLAFLVANILLKSFIIPRRNAFLNCGLRADALGPAIGGIGPTYLRLPVLLGLIVDQKVIGII